MDKKLEDKLIEKARERINNTDTFDFEIESDDSGWWIHIPIYIEKSEVE